MNAHRAIINTAGWHPVHDIKDQCGICTHVVTEQRMAACDFGKSAFPAAHNCPVFKFHNEDDDAVR